MVPLDSLHDLPGTGEVVIRDSGDIANFEAALASSNYYAIDLFGCDVVSSMSERLGLVSFCMKSRVFFVMPFLFPNTVEPVAELLRRCHKLAIRYRWQRRGPSFEQVFGWKPTVFLDAEEVAKEKGLGFSLNDMAQKIVESDFCRRGSHFGDLAMPSAAALHHRAIRVSLIYEYVVELKEFRSRKSRKSGFPAGARSDRDHKRKRDFEKESPEEHSRSKASRSDSKYRSHSDNRRRDRR